MNPAGIIPEGDEENVQRSTSKADGEVQDVEVV
jgi:hypothetical protein